MTLAIGPCGPNCGGRVAPIINNGSADLAVWVFLGIIVYVLLQCRASRREVWAARVNAAVPFFLHVGRDIYAVVKMVADWFNARAQSRKFRDQLGEDDSWPWS
jgi:hypothetical protein